VDGITVIETVISTNSKTNQKECNCQQDELS